MNINNGLEEFNKSTYKNALIYSTSKGFTSNLMKNLYAIGYRASLGGIVHTLYDNEGKKVCSSYSWIGILMETAKSLK